MNDVNEKLKRLDFEDFLLIVFICLNVLNMVGDYYERIYLKSNDLNYKRWSNKIFEFTLFVTIIIYFYFLGRNWESYRDISFEQKGLYGIKLFGTILVIVGIICLFYFQRKQSDFIGVPII